MRQILSVQVFLYTVIDGVVKFYLQQRALNISFGGQYSVTGGKVDSGETVEQAAIREVYEECGVKIKSLKQIGKTERKQDVRGEMRHYIIYQFAACFTGQVPTICSPDEAIADGIFDISEALQLDLTQRVREKLLEIQADNSIVIGEKKIKREETKMSAWAVILVDDKILVVQKKSKDTMSSSFTGGQFIFPGGVCHFDSNREEFISSKVNKRLGIATKEEDWHIVGGEETEWTASEKNTVKDYDITALLCAKTFSSGDIQLSDDYGKYLLLDPADIDKSVSFGPATLRFLNKLGAIKKEHGELSIPVFSKVFDLGLNVAEPKKRWWKRF